MRALSPQRLLGQLTRHIVVIGNEGIVAARLAAVARGLFPDGLGVPGVVPPVRWRLTRSRDHPGHERQHVDTKSIGDQGRSESAERLTHDDEVRPITDGLDDSVGELAETGGLVIGRKIGSHHVVPVRPQLSLDQMPVPTTVSRTVDQHKGSHASSHLPGQLPTISAGRSSPIIVMTRVNWSPGPRLMSHGDTPARPNRLPRIAGSIGWLEPILVGMSEELVEVVTAAGTTTAIVSRDDVLAGNLWHRTAFVIVRSSTGAVLAHRRAETKRIAPGMWDLGFGGAVHAGESYEAAAARELLEEAGINTPIHFVGNYVYEGSDSREVGRMFETVSDGPFQHPPDEVIESTFVDPADLPEFLASHDFCDAAIHVMVPVLRG
jgi:8-oxo-dGTP pyrophosphatase MutT (NUDIX family)